MDCVALGVVRVRIPAYFIAVLQIKMNRMEDVEMIFDAIGDKESSCDFYCPCADDTEDDSGYLDVTVSELKHPPPQLSPMPEGLSSQQVCLWGGLTLHIVDKLFNLDKTFNLDL